MKSPTLRLTDEEVDCFHRNGWLRIESFTTPQEARQIAALIDRIAEERRATGMESEREGDQRSSLIQIVNPVYDAVELVDTLIRANATAAAAQLLGAGAGFFGEQAMIKPPFHPIATEWHQDEAYWDDALEYQTITFWVALQDTKEENGCMRFLSGSHRWDVVRHRLVNAQVPIPDFEVADQACIDPRNVLVVPLPIGGATVHSCRTLHSAFCNRSAAPRKGYTLGFGYRPVRRRQSRRFDWNRRLHPQAGVVT
jgi:ectoine hydroxylase-related dioxygenase (phytanoyl-CoA dioxygenase family)